MPEDDSSAEEPASLGEHPDAAAVEPLVKSDVTAPEVLSEDAQIYLNKLLRNINTMLDYSNSNGVALSDDLPGKIDELFKNPAIKAVPAEIFSGNRHKSVVDLFKTANNR